MSIAIENLVYKYSPGTAYEKLALNDVNLIINSGEFVGLIGHTGSGKSTLIQHINGLIKAESGQVRIDDVNIYGPGVMLKDIRKKVGLVFQYPEHQLFEMTIYKDVAFGPTNMGLSVDEVDERVKWALSIVGMDESYYEVSPFDLSGGQKRRVAIAGVLAMKPKVLILDEPTAGLDPRGRDEILDEISKLHDELGITVILVSHSMEDIARYVDRVIVMDKGTIRLDGPVKEVFTQRDQLIEMGLSVPQVKELSIALKGAGISIDDNIITISEAKEAIMKLMGKRGQ